eukprot:TRINITY_DN7620_c0_g1_i2.p3 TRINITY_DN7620_c0_g1~~TRINITY_DN7620_c0_g1_i2.p3  ORF type:complete len:102 (-),score=15.28 TRINITY_DN7620_c0_g1_i2:580-885(-)
MVPNGTQHTCFDFLEVETSAFVFVPCHSPISLSYNLGGLTGAWLQIHRSTFAPSIHVRTVGDGTGASVVMWLSSYLSDEAHMKDFLLRSNWFYSLSWSTNL